MNQGGRQPGFYGVAWFRRPIKGLLNLVLKVVGSVESAYNKVLALTVAPCPVKETVLGAGSP